MTPFLPIPLLPPQGRAVAAAEMAASAALSSDPVLRAASVRAQQLGEVHGWSLSTVRCTMDGLMLLLAERGAGEPVTVSEIRARG
jgi:phospholipase/lecithinase/hemolysin